MSLLSRMERRLGWMAIHNITLYIVFGQVCGFLLMATHPANDADATPGIVYHMQLIPTLVLHGEVWRLFSFIFIPPTMNILFLFFDLYFFYFMGTALEANWGTFRYNIYLLIAYVMTIAVSFAQPDLPSNNGFILGSVLLAFAYLFPEFVIYLFLVLPVKIKWIAWLTWAGYVLAFVVGSLQIKLLIMASVLNFLLFFGKDIIHHVKTGHRRIKTHAARVQDHDQPFHVCGVCGITDKTHPRMDFRYCPLCVGSWGYCSEHLLNHEHKTQSPAQ